MSAELNGELRKPLHPLSCTEPAPPKEKLRLAAAGDSRCVERMKRHGPNQSSRQTENAMKHEKRLSRPKKDCNSFV
jgi:hypothetical protein